MSEIKVNEISGLGEILKINGQVGLPVIVGTNKLSVNGNVYEEGSVEVVTVSAQTYGIKIKGPVSPSTGNSIIKFTSYANDERAHIAAKNDNTLLLGTSGVDRLTIDSTGKIIHKYESEFVGKSQFLNTTTFSSPPICVDEPQIASELANKQYVDRKFLELDTATQVYQVFETPVGVNFVNGSKLSTINVPKNAKMIHGHMWRDTPQGPDFVRGWTVVDGIRRAERYIHGVYAHARKDGTGTFNEFVLPCAKYYGFQETDTYFHWDLLNTNLEGSPYPSGMASLGYWI